MTQRCQHRLLRVLKHPDRCTYIRCGECGKEGPKKHTYTLAVIAWLVRIGDQHPRRK